MAGGDGPVFKAGSFPPLVSTPLPRAAMSTAISSASAGPVLPLPLATSSLVPPSDSIRPSSPISVQDSLVAERQKFANLVAFLEHQGHALPIALLAGGQSPGPAVEGSPVLLQSPLVADASSRSPIGSAGPYVDPVLEVGPAQWPLQVLGPAAQSSATFGPQVFFSSIAAQSMPCTDTPLTLRTSAGTVAPATDAEFEIFSNSKSPALGPAHSLLPPVPAVQGHSVLSPSWSRVVQGRVSSASASDSSLRFFPPASTEGDVIIKPPQEVLRRGNSLWSTSLIGGFLHSRLPFKQVESFALKAWGGLGLQKVFLHAKGYFVFKFSSAAERENVLALGPWYISNKLLLLQHWKEGADLLQDAICKVPIWVKLYHVPYAYWTSEGLSYLASGIGKPLFLDTLTAKLEPLPYARVCIEIQAGATLPAKLLAASLDVDTGEETLIEVKVEYQSKPRSCGICSSFGHSQFKCPRANFQWVAKSSAPTSLVGSVEKTPLVDSPIGLPITDLPKALQGFPKSSPKGIPPKDVPSIAFPIAGPKGVTPKSNPKVSTDPPKEGFSQASVDRAVPEGPPEGPLAGSSEGLSPEGLPCFPKTPKVGSRLETGSRFLVLAEDREEDQLVASSDDEPPSWGPLVRRLKVIDAKEGRAMISEDVGPLIRAQSKQRKKKKSPKGK